MDRDDPRLWLPQGLGKPCWEEAVWLRQMARGNANPYRDFPRAKGIPLPGSLGPASLVSHSLLL